MLIVTNMATILPEDGCGKVAKYMSYSENETEDGSNEMLKCRYELLEDLLSLSLDPICVVGKDGRLLLANNNWASTFGFTAQEVMSGNFIDPVHPDYVNVTRAYLNALSDGSRAQHLVNRCRRWDGRYIWIEWSLAQKDGRLFAVGRDISEGKVVGDAANEAYRRLRILMSITRHDVNNHLASLSGHLDLLSMMRLAPEAASRIERAKLSVEGISSLMRFTHRYEEEGAIVPVWQELRMVVKDGISALDLGKVSIINDIPSDLEINADALLPKVFYILVDNALKHGEHIKAVRFSVEEADANLVVIAEDDGLGVPADAKKSLFANSGVEHGVGLFLSKEILALSSIGIRETGAPGRGARFELVVPREAWRRASLKGETGT